MNARLCSHLAVTMLTAALALSTAAQTSPRKTDSSAEALAKLKAQLGDEDFQFASTTGFVFAGNKVREQKFEDMVELTSTVARPLWKQYFSKRPTYPIAVYLFKDQGAYGAYAKKLYGLDIGKTTSGYYSGAHKILMATMPANPSTAGSDQSTFVHELVHALMAPDFPNAPIWFMEGMATLFEQYRFETNDELMGIPNARLGVLQEAIQQKRVVPLARFLAMDSAAFQSGERQLHYAQARYLCLYLQNEGVLQKFYRAFRDNVAADKTGAKTLQKLLSLPLDEIDYEWQRWIVRLH